MSIKSGLVRNEDYCLLTQANWLKLITCVGGGAPEIPVFYYTKEVDGVKISMHDFDPIKVRVRAVDVTCVNVLSTAEFKTVLASPYLGHKMFLQYVGNIITECAMNNILFVINPTNSKEVVVRATGTAKLFEVGLT